MRLSKSDFKIARSCATKLYYKKLGYSSLQDDDPYLEFLADGGYMVEAMARLLFPDGIELGDWERPERAFEQTAAALGAGDATLFEATIIHGQLLARVDILRRRGKRLELIEVKSSSIDSARDGASPFRGARGGIDARWRPYLEDVAFQAQVLGRAFPGLKVIPFLCVVDKSRAASANTVFDQFELSSAAGNRWRPQVEYRGDAAALRNEHLLAIIDVSSEVAELQDEIVAVIVPLARSLQGKTPQRIAPQIGKKCKNCEYRWPSNPPAKSGFAECWGALAQPNPHVLDLYRVDSLGGRKSDLVAQMAGQGRSALADVAPAQLSGAFAPRQKIQLRHSSSGSEYFAPALKRALAKHAYPLHFIDFEGSRLAIPYHARMRPYEQAAFQWSCHSLRTSAAALEHAQWLNTEDAFPNFAFAKSLKQRIGDAGTVYIWSPYEITVLKEIRRQMDDYGCEDTALADWLERITAKDNPRVVDLCDVARSSYFHPSMKGSVSIKQVLPAVWQADAAIRARAEFARYLSRDAQGQLQDPYASLPKLPIGAEEEAVTEGTGAMRVYQEMMFGRGRHDVALRANYRRLLLQYCELDTAAMVMIWLHWIRGETAMALP